MPPRHRSVSAPARNVGRCWIAGGRTARPHPYRERCQGVDRLPVHAQPQLTGRQHPQWGRRAQHPLQQVRQHLGPTARGSRARRSRSSPRTRSSTIASVAPATSNTSPTPCQTAVPVRAFSRRTNQRPSEGWLPRATSIASRVLPTPARPTTVTSRWAASSGPTAVRSADRPSSGAGTPVRFPGRGLGARPGPASSDPDGGPGVAGPAARGRGPPRARRRAGAGLAGTRPVRPPGAPPGTAR